MRLKSNYVLVKELQPFLLYQHHVHFNPEIDHTGIRRFLVNQHKKELGGKISFDGAILFTFTPIGNEDEPKLLTSESRDGTKYEVTIKFTKLLPSTDPQVMQVRFKTSISCKQKCSRLRYARFVNIQLFNSNVIVKSIDSFMCVIHCL